jgi:putative peptide zinc metalloprotease protein
LAPRLAQRRFPFRTTHQRRIQAKAPQTLTRVPVEAPELVPHTQLLGQYESSGMTDQRFLVRRCDGQVLLLTLVLYTILVGLDSHHDLVRVAEDVSKEVGQPVEPQVIAEAIDLKLKPLGVILSKDSLPAVPQAQKHAAPVLSLTLKGTLLPSGVTRKLARLLCPLHWPLVVLVTLEAFVAAEIWLFAVHGVSDSFTDLTAKPLQFLPVIGLVVGSSLFHELGHASACHKGGGVPGRVGYGIMLIFPAFYTDVTDAYRLDSKARVRTDLGGVYFNSITVVALAGIYYVTGYLPLVATIVLINVNMIQQMLPLGRLDGYYLLADLVGVPDLYARIKPTLRLRDDRSHQLHRHARRIITVWVLLVVPVIAFGVFEFLYNLPHFARATWDGFHLQWINVYWSWRFHHYRAVALASLSMIFLTIPILGVLALSARIGRRVLRRKPRPARPRPAQARPAQPRPAQPRPPQPERSNESHVQDEDVRSQVGGGRAFVPGPGPRFRISSQRVHQPQPGPGRNSGAVQEQHQDQLPDEQRTIGRDDRRRQHSPSHQL